MKKIQVSLLILVLSLALACSTEECENGDCAVDSPVLSIADVTVAEGNENGVVNVAVSLSAESATNVIVRYATIDQTAVGGSDFFGISDGTLTFSAGETSKDISITIKGDEDEEEDETFEVLLFSPLNAELGSDTRGLVTLTDDDSHIGGLMIPATGYSTPNSYDGMNLVWSDEFDAAELNTTDWTYEIGTGNGGWGNNELQYYREENTSIVDGHLVIEAKEEGFGGMNYTSSRLVTQNKQEFQYGRIDIRAALPSGQGIWPALWMLGTNFNTSGWPSCGEIDIMELVGHEANRVHGTVHYGNTPADRQQAGSSKVLSGGAEYGDEFHVFSMVWEENSIQIFMDDQLYFQFTDEDATDGFNYPFNQPFFFIFNVAVGGNWPGSPDGTTNFSQYMIVDYVRVFQ